MDNHLLRTADHVVAHAENAHALASGGAAASAIAELTRHAIGSWRDLAALDNASDNSPAPLARAPQVVGAAA